MCDRERTDRHTCCIFYLQTYMNRSLLDNPALNSSAVGFLPISPVQVFLLCNIDKYKAKTLHGINIFNSVMYELQIIAHG